MLRGLRCTSLAVLLLNSLPLHAQGFLGISPELAKLPQTTGTGTLRLQFLDSKSGSAVHPDLLLLNGRELPSRPDASGLLSLPGVPNGTYNITIGASEYERLEATVTVDGENTLVQTVELDHLDPVPYDTETTPSQDEAVIKGTVVDDLRGTRLPGAQISIAARNTTSETSSNGEYRLAVKTRTLQNSRGEVSGAERLTLNASLAGYRDAVFHNVEVPPGSVTRYPIRLRRADDPADDDNTTAPIVNTEPARRSEQRTYDWVFDVTAH
jgi:hypothetical protein